MSYFTLTVDSYNSKTGGIPVSTSSADTCPNSCPLKKNGCYADAGPMRFHWEKVTSGERGMNWTAFCAEVSKLPKNQMWRHNQAGDLPGPTNDIDLFMMEDLISASYDKRGFTYTHKTEGKQNLNIIEICNNHGFTVNLSANNIEHADKLIRYKAGPVTVILPSWHKIGSFKTPEGNEIRICPATYSKMKCNNCWWCWQNPMKRDYIIGIPIHGSQSYAAGVACGYRPNYKQPGLF